MAKHLFVNGNLYVAGHGIEHDEVYQKLKNAEDPTLFYDKTNRPGYIIENMEYIEAPVKIPVLECIPALRIQYTENKETQKKINEFLMALQEYYLKSTKDEPLFDFARTQKWIHDDELINYAKLYKFPINSEQDINLYYSALVAVDSLNQQINAMNLINRRIKEILELRSQKYLKQLLNTDEYDIHTPFDLSSNQASEEINREEERYKMLFCSVMINLSALKYLYSQVSQDSEISVILNQIDLRKAVKELFGNNSTK